MYSSFVKTSAFSFFFFLIFFTVSNWKYTWIMLNGFKKCLQPRCYLGKNLWASENHVTGKRILATRQRYFKMATLTEQSFVPSSSVNIEVEGDITVPGAPEEDEEPSTLDEPVSETLVRHFTSYMCFIEHFVHKWSDKTLKFSQHLIKINYLFERDIFQKRDLKAVGRKFFHIFWPRHTKSLLRDCKCITTTLSSVQFIF